MIWSCWHSLHTSVKEVQEREWIIDGQEDIPAVSHVLSNASQEPPAIEDVQMPPPWWLSQKNLNPFSVFAAFAFDCHLTFLCGFPLDACSPGLFQQRTSHPKTFHRTTSMLWSLKRNGTCPYMRWLLLRVFQRMKMQASRPCHHQLPITSTSCLKPGTGSGDHLCFSLFFYVLPVTVALNASHGCLFGCFIRHKSTSFGFKTPLSRRELLEKRLQCWQPSCQVLRHWKS